MLKLYMVAGLEIMTCKKRCSRIVKELIGILLGVKMNW